MIALNHSGEYWASAANPRHGPGSFAIAASNGCCIYFKEEDQWVLERNLCIQGLREAVAVDWLGPNVVLKGCREGAVRLWDHRSHAESTEPRIQHAVAVNHVRRIDENLVVVAGLKNEVSDDLFCPTSGSTDILALHLRPSLLQESEPLSCHATVR